MKTIRIAVLVIGAVFFSVGGWMFAASFAVDELGSWGKALREAHLIPIGAVAGGIALSFVRGKSRQWWVLAGLGLWAVSVAGFAWSLETRPPFMWGVCFFGITLFVLPTIQMVAELMRVFERPPAPPRQRPVPAPEGDPSLN